MSNQEINLTLVSLAFFAIGIGIAIVILFAIFMSRKNTIVRQRLEEQLSYQKRLHQSELRALRSQMNPHFVHNSLNAIQYYIQRNEVEISEDYLVRFSKLIRLFFEYSRRHHVTISEEIELLNHYLIIEKLRFEDKIDYTISVDDDIDQEEQTLPPIMLQPLVENAVNHGLFHKKGKGKIHISFEYIDDETFKVLIEDDGIGIKKAKKNYSHDTENNESHSSEVLIERLDLFKQNKEWNITYHIDDLSTISNQNGTRVSLTINQPNLL